jgi:hypothetical protein
MNGYRVRFVAPDSLSVCGVDLEDDGCGVSSAEANTALGVVASGFFMRTAI